MIDMAEKVHCRCGQPIANLLLETHAKSIKPLGTKGCLNRGGSREHGTSPNQSTLHAENKQGNTLCMISWLKTQCLEEGIIDEFTWCLY